MAPDQTFDLLRKGYTFGADVFAANASRDAAAIRFLGRPALLVTGEAGARLFYDASRLTRIGAVPALVGDLIFGRGGVQGLEGEAHVARRAVLLDLLGRKGVEDLTEVTRRRWQEAQHGWVEAGSVVLHDAAVDVLGRAALEWAGVQVPEPGRTARDLAAIVDGFGSVGPAHLRGRLARHRCERLARSAIHAARRGATPGAAPRSPLDVIAHARDVHGALLEGRVAGVELLNLLRPVVAIAWFIDFAAVALAQHPQWRERVGTPGQATDRTAFVHEVRRYYPLTPLLAARAREAISFDGLAVEAGERVLLDVIGVNHDPRLWREPWEFEPERFLRRRPGDHDFVPQGGGPWETGHRCPGEPMTVQVLAEIVRALADLPFRIPPAQLRFPAHRVPTRPRRGPELRDLATGPKRTGGTEPARPHHERDWTMSTHAELVAAVTAQHGQVTQLIARTKESEGDDRRANLAALRRLMALHEAAEQATLHPLLATLGGPESESGRERMAEEEEAANLVDRLDGFEVSSYEFIMQLQLLEEAMTFHATAEEERELPRLRDAPEADLRRAVGALATATALSAPDADWSPPEHSFRALQTAAADLFAPASTQQDGRRKR